MVETPEQPSKNLGCMGSTADLGDILQQLEGVIAGIAIELPQDCATAAGALKEKLGEDTQRVCSLALTAASLARWHAETGSEGIVRTLDVIGDDLTLISQAAAKLSALQSIVAKAISTELPSQEVLHEVDVVTERQLVLRRKYDQCRTQFAIILSTRYTEFLEILRQYASTVGSKPHYSILLEALLGVIG